MCAKFHQNRLKTVTSRPDRQTFRYPTKEKIFSNRRLRSLGQLSCGVFKKDSAACRTIYFQWALTRDMA